MVTGYSGTPLGKKLGIKEGFIIKLYAAPKHYFDLFNDLPTGLSHVEGTPDPDSLDFIHIFTKEQKHLSELIHEAKTSLKKQGVLWVSWPKSASKIQTDINRDIIRDLLLNIGLVDVKVAAIDETWSGLKFVYRLKDR